MCEFDHAARVSAPTVLRTCVCEALCTYVFVSCAGGLFDTAVEESGDIADIVVKPRAADKPKVRASASFIHSFLKMHARMLPVYPVATSFASLSF